MRIAECFHNWPGDLLLLAVVSCRAVVLGKDQPVDRPRDDCRHPLSPPASSPSSPCLWLKAEVSKIPEARLQDALLPL